MLDFDRAFSMLDSNLNPYEIMHRWGPTGGFDTQQEFLACREDICKQKTAVESISYNSGNDLDIHGSVQSL